MIFLYKRCMDNEAGCLLRGLVSLPNGILSLSVSLADKEYYSDRYIRNMVVLCWNSSAPWI